MATQLADLQNQQPDNKPLSFPKLLEKSLGEIKRALPEHLSKDRMARIALTAFRRQPKLAECDPRSVLAACIQSAQLGLELDTLGRAYLVPYKVRVQTREGWRTVMECQFIPGWKGLVDLLNRSGQGTAWTGAVFAGDKFEYELGDNPHVKHKPTGDSDPDKLLYAYAIGRVKGSDYPIIEVWTAERLKKHRDRYNKVGDSHYSFQNWEMYCRKVVLLQVLKYMPLSAEMVRAVELDHAAEAGRQGLGIDDAIDGTWAPVMEEGSDPPAPQQEAANSQDAPPQQQAAARSAASPIPPLTAEQIAEKIANAETGIKVDEMLDLARSSKFDAASLAKIEAAAKEWKEKKAAQAKQRRSAVD